MTMLERVFEAVGVTDAEERIYRLLLANPAASPSELARTAGVASGKARQALSALEAKGLASRSPGRAVRYVPAPPEPAIQLLILRRQEELESARLAASRLAHEYRESLQRSRPGDLVEIVVGLDAVAQRFLQMQRGATSELLVVDRPPYASPEAGERSEEEILSRGVRYRTIYAQEALEVPGKLARVQQLARSGEEARVLPDVATKLAIADRRVGLVPLDFRQPGIEDAVLVHASFLLDALIMLFEALWERAVPLRLATEGGDEEGAPETTGEPTEERIVALLAAGLKDESIARALGISRSTVERRIRALMQSLGAKTRFQTGMLLEERRHRNRKG